LTVDSGSSLDLVSLTQNLTIGMDLTNHGTVHVSASADVFVLGNLVNDGTIQCAGLSHTVYTNDGKPFNIPTITGTLTIYQGGIYTSDIK
jgi:hypothetical protein